MRIDDLYQKFCTKKRRTKRETTNLEGTHSWESRSDPNQQLRSY